MIGVNFIAGKVSDFVVSLDVIVDRVLLFEIVPHLCYWVTGILTTKAGVQSILEITPAKVVGGIHPVIKPD